MRCCSSPRMSPATSPACNSGWTPAPRWRGGGRTPELMREPMLRPATNYDALWKQVDFANFRVPEFLNLGVVCVDEQDPDGRAMTVVATDGTSTDHTSGTTGDPKGALHAHRVLFGHITAFEMIYEFYPQPDDVLSSPADWAWLAGIMNILVPAWYYGLPIVVDLDTKFSPERAIWLLRTFRVTLTVLHATALRMIRATGRSGGGFALRVVASGGEAIGADLLAWSAAFFGGRVNEGYGQTELNASLGNCELFPTKPGSLGRPFPGTVVAVLDDNGTPVIGRVGEI